MRYASWVGGSFSTYIDIYGYYEICGLGWGGPFRFIYTEGLRYCEWVGGPKTVFQILLKSGQKWHFLDFSPLFQINFSTSLQTFSNSLFSTFFNLFPNISTKFLKKVKIGVEKRVKNGQKIRSEGKYLRMPFFDPFALLFQIKGVKKHLLFSKFFVFLEYRD